MGKPTYAASRSPSLWLRDPECFIAGEIHRHLDVWDKLTQGLPNRDEIMYWICEKSVCLRLCTTVQGSVWWLHLRFQLPCAKNHNGSHCCRCRWRPWKGWTMCPSISCDATDCRTKHASPMSGPALPELLDAGYALPS